MNEHFERLFNFKSELKVLNKTKESADIYMYGPISNFSNLNSKVIKNELENINAETINVFINSPGGDVFESVAIYNLLKRADAKIHVFIDGLAASGASLIAMAGDKVSMPKNSQMMIHNAWAFAGGDKHELRKVANDLESIDKSVLNSYMDRFIGSKEDLQVLLDAETFLDAEQAIALGLADDEEEKKDDEVEESDDKEIEDDETTEQTDDIEEEKEDEEELKEKQNAILHRFVAMKRSEEKQFNFLDLFKN